MEHDAEHSTPPTADVDAPVAPISLVRIGIAGVLMGLANLVPGVSGGTMVLVMGLYDEFVTAVADITRLRITRRNLIFIGLLGAVAATTIGMLSGRMGALVTGHRLAMYSLFIGMTLGGAPLLYQMLRPLRPSALIGAALGFAVMIAIVLTRQEKPSADELVEGAVAIHAAYGTDLIAGLLGMSAMVLPGISGAYMLLILGRYETILRAIHEAKDYAVSFGGEGDIASALRVIVPVGIGAVVSVVGLSNLLKWLLHHHEHPTLGVLLGVLLGSVIGIWPFHATSTSGDYGIGAALTAAGFVGTFALSRMKA
jgi:putative membrane protein